MEERMDDAIATVLARIDIDRQTVLEFVRSLVRRQAEGETAVQEAVADGLAAAGGHVELIAYQPSEVPLVDEFAASNASPGERASVVARFVGRGGGRSIMTFAHPDSEPVGDTSSWRHDPFAGMIEDGRLYGWGIADDIAGVAIAVSAMTAIKTAGVNLAGDVIITSTPSKRHARGVAAVLNHGYGADAAVYLHPAESGEGLNEIKAFSSGQLEFSVTVTGRKAETTEPVQTAFAHLAINPLDKAMLVIDAIRKLDADRGTRIHHPLLDAAIGRSTNIMISSVQFGRQRGFYQLPVQCTFSGAIAFPPGESIATVQAEVEACVERISSTDGWLVAHKPELRWISATSGVEVADTHPLYRTVADVITAVTGTPPHVNPLHTSSDIRNPKDQKNIATVGIGPRGGNLTQNNEHDEWVDVEDYLRAVKVMAGSIMNWSGVSKT
jgi:acetylornithine deacetylase